VVVDREMFWDQERGEVTVAAGKSATVIDRRYT
jgi:hypothetical protein